MKLRDVKVYSRYVPMLLTWKIMSLAWVLCNGIDQSLLRFPKLVSAHLLLTMAVEDGYETWRINQVMRFAGMFCCRTLNCFLVCFLLWFAIIQDLFSTPAAVA